MRHQRQRRRRRRDDRKKRDEQNFRATRHERFHAAVFEKKDENQRKRDQPQKDDKCRARIFFHQREIEISEQHSGDDHGKRSHRQRNTVDRRRQRGGITDPGNQHGDSEKNGNEIDVAEDFFPFRAADAAHAHSRMTPQQKLLNRQKSA